MPIKKSVTVAVYGAPASFHVVTSYAVEVSNNRTVATVLQYFDENAYAQGRQPLGSEHIILNALPPADAPTLGWIEQQLIAPEPAEPEGYEPPNRYALSGGEIVSVPAS